MSRSNCWELKACGREPGGKSNHELGICPAAADISAHGLNSGKNGGRICWAIAGTFCGGIVQGTFAQKKIICNTCEVYKQVKEEEGASFLFLMPDQVYSPSRR